MRNNYISTFVMFALGNLLLTTVCKLFLQLSEGQQQNQSTNMLALT